MKKVEIKERKLVFDDFFKIESVTLRHEHFDGGMSSWMRRLNFLRGDSVAAVVFNKDTRRVILVNQFRYPTYDSGRGWLLEIPAGILERGEDPEEAMRREIMEELGYRADTLVFINEFFLSPGGSSERIFLFYAEVDNKAKVAEGGGVETEHENIQVMEISLNDLLKKLEHGEITDAKTIIALMWLKNKTEETKG